jgi:hypothetical protein
MLCHTPTPRTMIDNLFPCLESIEGQDTEIRLVRLNCKTCIKRNRKPSWLRVFCFLCPPPETITRECDGLKIALSAHGKAAAVSHHITSIFCFDMQVVGNEEWSPSGPSVMTLFCSVLSSFLTAQHLPHPPCLSMVR